MSEIDHCLSCPVGGYVIHRHNKMCDLTAQFLKEICHDVSIEPQLQPPSEESLTSCSANQDIAERLDVSATDFWERKFFLSSYKPCQTTHFFMDKLQIL